MNPFRGDRRVAEQFSRSVKRVGACLAALLLVAGCSLYPAQDGVSQSAPGGLEEIARHYDLRPLDPRSTVPLTKQALEELEKTDLLRAYRGTTYRLTSGNRLPRNRILQTPNVWGKAAAEVTYFPVDCLGCDADLRLPTCAKSSDCGGGRCLPLAASVAIPGSRPRKFCVGHSDEIVDVVYNLVASARQSVDIAMLQPAVDIRFLTAQRNAITRLAYSGRAVTIRAIVGDYPPGGFDAAALLSQLTRGAMGAPGSRIRVFAGAIRSCDGSSSCGGLSWNHAKIIAVDGRTAIVGGHNLWTPDYLADAPAHDISMMVEGPAADDAHRFADALWGSLCSRRDSSGADANCLRKIELPDQEEERGGVAILAVGRLAAGIAPVFVDQSLIARDLMLGAATRSIRLLQQDAAFAALGAVDRAWPESALGAIADLIGKKDGDVYMVLSNLRAAGPVGTYSNGVPIEAVAQKIKDVVGQRTGIAEPELSRVLCRRLHLAPLRFGPDASWPMEKPIGTHAKFWMVDERAFYIGSENLYPTNLQEFGYIVEDSKAAAELRQAYWDKAWSWSRAAAISGDDAPRCIFGGA